MPIESLLQKRFNDQQHLLTAQARQINLLNEKITSLEEKSELLQNMRKEIRKIGQIEQPVYQDNFFGIGGSRVEHVVKTTEAEDTYQNKKIEANPYPDKNLQRATLSEPSDVNGRAFVLDHYDFYINPIACIPSSLPTDGTITNEPPQFRQLIAKQKDSYQGVLLKTTREGKIMTPANGIITFVGGKNDAGNTVMIDHGHGYVTRYTCLESVTKKLGELVLKGEVIGHAKTSPSDDPPQISYEIILNGLPVNPEKYITHDPFLL